MGIGQHFQEGLRRHPTEEDRSEKEHGLALTL